MTKLCKICVRIHQAWTLTTDSLVENLDCYVQKQNRRLIPHYILHWKKQRCNVDTRGSRPPITVWYYGYFKMHLRIYCCILRCGIPIMAHVSKVSCRLSLRVHQYTCAGPSQESLSRHCTLMKHPNWIQWTTQCLLTSTNYCPTGPSLVRGLGGWRVREAVLGIKKSPDVLHTHLQWVNMWQRGC